MLVLGAAADRQSLGSKAVVADSDQTLLCTYRSAVLPTGLLLNVTLGWSWTDPITGLVIAAVAIREALQALGGQGCSCALTDIDSPTDDAGDIVWRDLLLCTCQGR